jgi:hypothetical protein
MDLVVYFPFDENQEPTIGNVHVVTYFLSTGQVPAPVDYTMRDCRMYSLLFFINYQ